MGIAGLVLGIIGLIIGWIPILCILGFLLSIIGLILSILDIIRKDKTGNQNFGNALAGYCILTITYLAFSIPDSMSFGFVITPILHAYFDIFDGLIQMAVFTMLTMVNVAQEAPSKEEERAIEQLA